MTRIVPPSLTVAAWFLICVVDADAAPGVRPPVGADRGAPTSIVFRQRGLEPRWALTHVNVVDVRTGAVEHDANVEIGGDEVLWVGHRAPQPDQQIVDGKGKWVIPGLFDLHAHIPGAGPPRGSAPGGFDQPSVLRTLLRSGITAIRALPIFSETGPLVAAQVASGAHLGPTIIAASSIFEKEPERGSLGFHDPETAAHWVEKEALNGVRWIKIYNSMDSPSLRAIVTAAHAHGLHVLGHALGVLPGEASALGIDSIEHNTEIPLSCARSEASGAAAPSSSAPDLGTVVAWRWQHVDDSRCRQLMDQFAERGTAWVPTLVVMEKMIEAGAHDRGPHMSDATRKTLQQALTTSARLAVYLHRKGGKVGVGTDFPIDGVSPGTSVARELHLFVQEGGATPLEALQMGTLGSARILGLDRLMGTIEAGKLANLVLLDGNPLESIENVQRVSAVVHSGWLHDAATLTIGDARAGWSRRRAAR
jgi:imidazolonepropionase-like amidohydrolase